MMLASFVVNTDLDDASGSTDGLISLREAIIAAETNAAFGDAPAGDANGDSFSFSALMVNPTVSLTNGEFVITDDLVINGSLANVTIDAQQNSRIFNIATASNVQLTGLTLTGGSVSGDGGAILFAGAGTLTLTNVDIEANTAANGGGIFSAGANLVINNSTFVGNTAVAAAGSGGGLFTASGNVSINNSTFNANVANRAGGAIEIVDGSLRTFAVDMTANIAGPSGSAAPGSGGAIHVTGAAGTVVRVTGGVIDGNEAALEGGAFWNQNGSVLVVRDADVTNNIANGAAAVNGGGAIFNNGGTTRVIASTLRGNIAAGASGSGGAILSTNGVLNVRDGSQIVGNTAVRAGGGIEIINGYARIDGSAIGTLAEGNVAGGVGANPGDGGGLHVSGNLSSNYVLLANTTVRGNVATNSGGGLWNQTNARLVVRNNSTVEGNVAAGTGASAGGGGIFNNGGTVRVIGSEVINNDATGNLASGGGIHSNGGALNVRSASTISGNVAAGLGGGVAVRGGYAQIDDTVIGGIGAGVGNEALEGGGIFVAGSSGTVLVVDSSEIEGNVGLRSGGGVWIGDDAVVLLRNGTVVRANVAAGDGPEDGGGGIYLAGNSYLGLRSSTVTDNDVTGTFASGGGLYIAANAVAELVAGVVSSNTATLNGGGIFNLGELSADANSLITLNTATSGGGVFSEAGSNTNVVISTVTNNTPDNIVG